jgi:hypothetical protein
MIFEWQFCKMHEYTETTEKEKFYSVLKKFVTEWQRPTISRGAKPKQEHIEWNHNFNIFMFLKRWKS